MNFTVVSERYTCSYKTLLPGSKGLEIAKKRIRDFVSSLLKGWQPLVVLLLLLFHPSIYQS